MEQLLGEGEEKLRETLGERLIEGRLVLSDLREAGENSKCLFSLSCGATLINHIGENSESGLSRGAGNDFRGLSEPS